MDPNHTLCAAATTTWANSSKKKAHSKRQKHFSVKLFKSGANTSLSLTLMKITNSHTPVLTACCMRKQTNTCETCLCSSRWNLDSITQSLQSVNSHTVSLVLKSVRIWLVMKLFKKRMLYMQTTLVNLTTKLRR